MSKRIIFISAALLAIVGGGLWYYFARRPAVASDVWACVPANALTVYETTDLLADWNSFAQSPLGNALRAVPDVEQFNQQLAFLDSLPRLRPLLQQPWLMSLQVVGSEALGATFYTRVSTAEGAGKKSGLTPALEQLQQEAALRTEARQYHGLTIHTLSTADGEDFSYVLHRGVLVGSFTAFLVEDVVRLMTDGAEGSGFAAENPSLLRLPKLADDEGNLYLNVRRLSRLLSVFTEAGALDAEELDALGQAMLLDVRVQEQQLLLNGFSASGSSSAEGMDSATLLQTFAGQQARTIGIGDYLPERTAWLYHLSLSDAERWAQALRSYQAQRPGATFRQLADQRNALEEAHQVSLSAWYTWFGQELGMLTLASVEVEQPDRALLIEVQDTTAAGRSLRSLATSLSGPSDVYREQFSSYTIGELAQPELPALLLGPMASGYPHCFYLLTDRYLIMANNVRTLKRLMLDREAENTWSKSLKQSRFMANTLNDANLSLVVDVAQSWELLLPRLSPRWRQLATDYASSLKQIEKVAVQFADSEELFYTNVVLRTDPQPAEPLARRSFTKAGQVFTDQPIRTKPHVVRNHNTQAREVIFQDEDNVLRLVASDQQVLWQDSLGAPVVGDIQQLDFYNNGKLQYLFATDSAIHVLDRNGSPVAGYPLYMPAGVQIQYLSLIDYDNSKRYRFLVSDTQGGQWMFNTDRENLEGWNPLGLASPLASAPFHARVRGKDYLIAIGQDGTVYAKNRRGEDYPGFPLALGQPCHSPAFVHLESTPNETTLTLVADGGELITVNLQGGIAERTQLYRPSADARFTLCEDALGKTFVLLRQDARSLGVLNQQGVLLFEKDFFSPGALASERLVAQYYDFGAGHQVYALTDQVQGFTYLFDEQGQLVNERPIESDFAVGLIRSEGSPAYRLYRNFENEFAILTF
ncbi:MAG: hypothetical protein WA958_22130 [Tunicatimonas sp.]